MADKNVFASASAGRAAPVADTRNYAGGQAHAFEPRHLLAQVAATGTFNKTFYNDGDDQLQLIRAAADQCSPEFVAKCAIYARQKAHMKDMPAALAVILSKADPRLLDRTFDRIIDNGKQIRNFVQIVRSGMMGRKSLGSGPKRLIRRWIHNRSARALFRASVGNSPSLADVVKLVHVKGKDAEQTALLGYILGREYNVEALPQSVKDFEAFKRGETSEVPDVDMRMLTSLDLKPEHWAQIARRGAWTQTRMNLNSYTKQGVFGVKGMEQEIAAKLRDPEAIRKAKMFPYQLFAAYQNTRDVPPAVREALQDAMEIAIENVPTLGTQVHVIVDVSGSMRSPVTGTRKGATTSVRCVDVAALIGAVFLRKNPGSTVLPVDVTVHSTASVNPRDSVMTNVEKFGSFGGAGTNLGAAMTHLNAQKAKGQLIVIASDNESWMDSDGRTHSRWLQHYPSAHFGATKTMEEFRIYQARNPGAKLVCIDMAPYGTTQAPEAPGDVLNIGGFSDAVFKQIEKFYNGTVDAQVSWVDEIEAISLDVEVTPAP